MDRSDAGALLAWVVRLLAVPGPSIGASLLALVAVVVVVRAAMTAGEQADDWRSDVLSALTYTTNSYQIADGGDHFRQFADVSPLLHVWSVAIEGQSCLVLPVVAWVLVRVGLRGGRLAVGLAVPACLASAWTGHLSSSRADAVRLNFGTDNQGKPF